MRTHFVITSSATAHGEPVEPRGNPVPTYAPLVLSLSKDGRRWFDKLTMSGGRRTLKMS